MEPADGRICFAVCWEPMTKICVLSSAKWDTQLLTSHREFQVNSTLLSVSMTLTGRYIFVKMKRHTMFMNNAHNEFIGVYFIILLQWKNFPSIYLNWHVHFQCKVHITDAGLEPTMSWSEVECCRYFIVSLVSETTWPLLFSPLHYSTLGWFLSCFWHLYETLISKL